MEQLENVLSLNCIVEVTKENVNKEELFKVLKYLKPTWTPSNLICKNLTGGFINLILRCYMDSNPDDSVVFRIWSSSASKEFEFIMNRPVEKGLLQKLGEKGVSPKLFATFNNGVCYEYFDGEKLTPELCSTDEIAKPVAKNFASVHATRVSGFSPKLECFKLTNCGYEAIQRLDPEKSKNLPSKEKIEEEINFLEKYLEGLKSPIVQCHGDAHASNMMYNKTTGKVILLDYEITYMGYQPADLAAFFIAQSCDYNNPSEGFQFNRLPEESYQRKFLRWYLEEWFESNGRNASEVTEKDVTKLFIQVNKYLLFTIFNTAMLFTKHYSIENKEGFHELVKTMDWCRLAKRSFQIYFEKKDFYSSLQIPD